MIKTLKFKLSKLIVNFFGDVQFFPYPFFCLLWGNTHYLVKGEEARAILNNLHKGDILLIRFDRYVSSWFIPGFYTHVVLYAGDNRIVHAVTKGVLEEDILNILRSDYVCVLRPIGVSNKAKKEAVDLARTFVGRDYDFEFSNSTDDLYCSELVRKAYGDFFDGLNDGKVISPDSFKDCKKLEVIHDSKTWRKDIGK